MSATALHIARSLGNEGIRNVPGLGRVKFIISYDIPWLAGSSERVNPRTSNPDVFIQRGTQTAKRIRGKTYEFAFPYAVHELAEREKGPYSETHTDAKTAEKEWVQKYWPDLPIAEYNSESNHDIARAARIARTGKVRVPDGLVKKPYTHPHNPLDKEMYDEVFHTHHLGASHV